VEFLPIRKTVKQNLISLSIFQNPKTPKQNQKNPQPSMLYNSFIIVIIIITIIKYKNHNKNANKNTSRFTTKKHQTKHEFVLQF
jgi:prolipoprotein diacylglyceryltransferase